MPSRETACKNPSVAQSSRPPSAVTRPGMPGSGRICRAPICGTVTSVASSASFRQSACTVPPHSVTSNTIPGMDRRRSSVSDRALISSTSPLSPAATASTSPVSSSAMFCGFSPALASTSGRPHPASSRRTLSASAQSSKRRVPSGDDRIRFIPGPPAKSPVGTRRSASSRQTVSPQSLAQNTAPCDTQSAPAPSSRICSCGSRLGGANTRTSSPPETIIRSSIAATPLLLKPMKQSSRASQAGKTGFASNDVCHVPFLRIYAYEED